MTVYYHQIRALIDPEQSDPLPGGGRLQDVSIILTGRVDGVPDWPAGITLLACQARELALELLELAEHADHDGRTRHHSQDTAATPAPRRAGPPP